MFDLRLVIGHYRAKLLAQLGEFDGHGAIDEGMTVDVGNVVCQGSRSKRQFIDICRFKEKVLLEVPRAHVMGQVAEQSVSERIVAKVL